MTKYAILIYEAESGYAEGGPDVWQEVGQAHGRFSGQVGEKGGKIEGGEALQPTSTATSIRGDVVTDGPFAETKEALGGFYLIDARDLDHAIEIARLCPARFGGVEVRPIMDTTGMG
ncbi:MAG TPA: YciI family protein [Streptosporangiaceae bacterium]|nr:YciI family protein [Streptosporangiaceae bacterium]